ncbi:MAG: hypothetical protein ABI548_05235 [Polyangiaceae bacterium]
MTRTLRLHLRDERLRLTVPSGTEISFDEYQSKVVAYLDPSQAPLYADRSAWDAMQGAVAEQLEALQ